MAFEMIRLDRASDEPLHEQLYRQIRDEFVSATFNNNSSCLSSSRELAADLGVAILCKRILLPGLIRKATFNQGLDRYNHR